MTLSTPLASRHIARTPLVTRHSVSSDVLHLHVASRPGQANGTPHSSPTPLPSRSTSPSSVPTASSPFHDASREPHPRIAPCSVRSHASFAPPSTPPVSRPVVPTPLAARPIAPTALVTRHTAPSDISHPHVAARPEQANGTAKSSSIPLPSYPTATSSHFHVASHVAHPHIASRLEQANGSFNSPSTPLSSRSKAHSMPPCSSPPRRKRSQRCFVCGGTGKHRLNPRFCPQTFVLISKHLATFNATFRLVSFDGSPLPMTRHPGGVAAHLLSLRRRSHRTLRISPHSVLKLPGGFHPNPLHVPHVPQDRPVCTPWCVPNTVPDAEINPPHVPCPSIVKRHHIPSTEPSFESNPPHLPRAQRPPSPPFRILDPIRKPLPHIERLPSPPFRILDPLPRPETPLKSTPQLDNMFFLLLFDCLILSPSWRRALAGLIDGINRLSLDDDIPALQKLMEPLRERFKTFVPSV
ncbi:hypothetical protein MVEN_00910000 [Mycena venus]|uniref:Uncharacterized protein n=1 Tax=Mycena venus TaxID=2733690 RepID=A0A8H6Y7P9_9AGAR|nr:hypothetical protein MVEN_00910000 [Mycena venus]